MGPGSLAHRAASAHWTQTPGPAATRLLRSDYRQGSVPAQGLTSSIWAKEHSSGKSFPLPHPQWGLLASLSPWHSVHPPKPMSRNPVGHACSALRPPRLCSCWPVLTNALFPIVPLVNFKILTYFKLQMKGYSLIGISLDHYPHPTHHQMSRVCFLWEYLHENTYHPLILVAFLGLCRYWWVGGWSHFPERVDTWIMPDPGSPGAPGMTLPAPSKQCASKKADWN